MKFIEIKPNEFKFIPILNFIKYNFYAYEN
jgi:hypothetical protein